MREGAPQVLIARFMYSPIDMITLTGINKIKKKIFLKLIFVNNNFILKRIDHSIKNMILNAR